MLSRYVSLFRVLMKVVAFLPLLVLPMVGWQITRCDAIFSGHGRWSREGGLGGCSPQFCQIFAKSPFLPYILAFLCLQAPHFQIHFTVYAGSVYKSFLSLLFFPFGFGNMSSLTLDVESPDFAATSKVLCVDALP